MSRRVDGAPLMGSGGGWGRWSGDDLNIQPIWLIDEE